MTRRTPQEDADKNIRDIEGGFLVISGDAAARLLKKWVIMLGLHERAVAIREAMPSIGVAADFPERLSPRLNRELT